MTKYYVSCETCRIETFFYDRNTITDFDHTHANHLTHTGVLWTDQNRKHGSPLQRSIWSV